jgi:TonB family protein
VNRWLIGTLGGVLCAALGWAPIARAEPPADPRSSSPISDPKLVTFVPAEYPKEANEKGLEANVDLVLVIDKDGRVESADVLAPAGHGFDEAAVAAAKRFVFQPAERDGRPVKSKIVYRYSFHFTKAPKVEEKPAPAVIRGRVEIAGAKTPLAGAIVVVTPESGPALSRTTTADGSFEVKDLAPGRYRVEVTAEGFEPSQGVEELGVSEEVSLKLALVPVAAEDEVVVHGVRPIREVTRRTVTRRELSRVPGTSGDALRALQNLPGVNRPPALSGVLIVRGNADQTTPVFIDGLWVPNIYHFGGLSSVVPTEMLDEVNFYPGNFSVKYGRALAGVVDAHLRETRNDGRYHGLLQLDLIDVRAMAEGPVPLASGWNFIGGFRRSHVDAWLIPLLEGEDTQIKGAPVYYDWQLMFDKRPTKSSYLRIGLLGFDDRVRLVDESSPMTGSLASTNASLGIGAIYKNRLSPKTNLDLTLSLARSHQSISISNILIDTEAYGFLARGEVTTKLASNLTLRAGVDSLLAPYNVNGQLPEDSGGGEDVGPFITVPTRTFDHTNLFFLPAVYGELTTTPSKRSALVSGVRVDYNHEGRAIDVSPRISGRYDVIAGSPRTTVKAGSGIFHQAPGLGEVVLSEDATDLRSTRSWQNSLGVEQELGEHLELSVEGFYNLLDDLIGRAPDENGVLAYNNLARGRVYGAEAMLRYRADEHFFGWLSYTLSRSERTWGPGEETELFSLDQPHILTLLGSYSFGSGWEIGARFRYVTGNLYTPCVGSLFNSTATSYVCVSGPPQSKRLPPFHQLDVRIDKRWVFSSFTLGVYLDVINAYNRTNPDFIGYNFDFTKQRPETGSLPFVPSLGVRGEF